MKKLVKKYFGVSEVAIAMSSDGDTWTPRRARRWMIRTSAGEKLGGRWFLSRSKLLSAFPELLSTLNDMDA